jgi:hypothetical protein
VHLFLAKGENGITASISKAKQAKERILQAIIKLDGIYPAFKQSNSFNELILETDLPVRELQEKAEEENLQIGVNATGRISKNDKRNLIKLTFTDVHEDKCLLKLIDFLRKISYLNQLRIQPIIKIL